MKISGKKTYAAAFGAIITAIQPIFTDTGIDLSLVDGNLLWIGLLAIFLRQGVSKSGPKQPSLNSTYTDNADR